MSKASSRRAFIRQHKATIEEANRRIAELKNAGEQTPALDILTGYINKSRRIRFNRNLPLETLEQSLAQAKKFIKSKSSTIEGMEQIRVTHDQTISDIVRQYGQEGIATNTTEVYNVLGSQQWRRAQSTIDSEIVMAYVNRQIAAGKSARAVKGQITKMLSQLGREGDVDATVYMRERWKI